MQSIYVIVIHTPTGRAFALNRKYGLLGELENPRSVIAASKVLDTWKGWRSTGWPEWAVELPNDDFEAFWVDDVPADHETVVIRS